MAIEDYIPNVFGSAPAGYQGLLGDAASADLQKRANISGLLSAGLALAQGMSSQGARRSALQNILGAAAAGYGGAAQAYEGGLKNIVNVQQASQAMAQRDAVEKLLADPRISSDPLKVAFIRANPNDALKMFAELLPVQEAISGRQVPAPTPAMSSQPAVSISPDGGQVMEVAPVTATQGIDAQLLAQKNSILAENQRLSSIPSKMAQDRVKSNLEQITAIDKQLDRAAVSGFDFNSIEAAVPEQFKGRVRSLRAAADTGAISMSDLTQRLQDIEKDAITFVTKKTDYTNQDRRVAAGMFQGRSIEELNPAELMQLENKLYEMRIAERKAGATSINMPSESERTAGFLTNRVINSLNQLQSVVGITPTAASPNFSAEAVKFLTGSDYLKNLANPEARQRVEAAQLEILDAALTLGTGAAYTREQLDNYRKSYFPQLNDKPGTIKDKQQRLKSLLDSAMIKSGRAAPTTQSNAVAPAFDMQAIEAELNRRKGK